MSSKKSTIYSSNIHVFGVTNVKSCSKEEYELIFNKDFDVSSFCDNKYLFDNLDKTNNHVLDVFRNHNYKKIHSKLVASISLALFMASNPISCFALSSSNNNFFKDMIERLGTDLLDGVSMGAIKGVLIVTALRLFVEYTRGGSKYKFFDITKQCIIVLLIIIILPTLPGIVNLVVNKYLTY